MKRSATPTVSPESPNGHQALSAYIRARFDEFSRSQKDVAQYIVDHLDEAAFQTAEELARRASTSSSTVVRFSQALGFEGFPELQQAARDEYRRRPAGAAAEMMVAAPLFSLDHTEFEAALAADHVNVEDTARKLAR
jgi:DNA-binding MurR/RpiR family transcriptional regulator